MMALLARLKIAHKLLISSAVLALPIIVLLYSVVSGYNEGIGSTNKELEGTRRLEPLLRMAEDVRVHQRLDYLRLKGDLRGEAQRNEAARRIDEVLAGEAAPQLAARWQQIRAHQPATPAESVAAHQQLAAAVRDLVGEVGDSSTLVLDPDLDSYYLVELTVVLLPQANLSDAAMLANEAAHGEQLSERDLLQFAIYAAALENSTLPQVRHAAETSLREDRNFHGVSESLQQNLPGLLSRYQAAVAACAEQMRRYSRMPDSSVTALQLAGVADRAAQVGWDFRRASIAELSVLLEKRASDLRWKRAAAVGSGVLALAFAWLIVLVIARNITVPLGEVVKLASDVAGGRVREGHARLFNNGGVVREMLATSGARDEICQLVRAIGQMTASLNSLLAERQQAEQTLRESEERYRATFANAAVGIAHVGSDGRWLRFNDAVCAITGYSHEELCGKTFADITHPDDIEADWALARRVAAGEIPTYSMEKRYFRKDSSIVWVNLTVSLLRDSSGAPQHYIAIIEDITQRKQAEERFRLAVEAAPNGMVVTNGQGEIVLVNSYTEKLFGYSREELIGERVEILVPDRFRVPHQGYRQGFLSEPQARPMGAGRDLYGLRKDGSEFPIEIGLNPIQTDHQEVLVLSSIIDITERRHAEATSRLLASIVESSADGIMSKDLNGLITSWNSGAESIFGYSAEEMIGRPISAIIPPGRVNEIPAMLERLKKGERIEQYETVRRAKSGKLVNVSITWSPIHDAMGRIVGASKVVRDITERKQAEQERLELLAKERALALEKALRETEAELARVVRTLTVGELATSIAHEVNQPLAGVVTNAEAGLRWLAGEKPNLHEVRESFALIVRDGNRASNVIRHIREFLKKENGQTASLDINEVVQEAVALAQGELLKCQITLRIELSGDLPPVRGDRIQLQQVVLNLIMNGGEAIATITEGPRELLVTSQKSDDGGIIVAVRDSGIGLKPQDMTRMFDAFYSTKPNGMGLGLSISRSIMEAHGGRIWAEANYGPGLTVQFSLPAERVGQESQAASSSL